MKNVLLFLFVIFSQPCFAAKNQNISMQLHQISVVDLARIVYGDALRQSFVMDSEVILSMDAVSLNWIALTKLELDAMTRELLNMHGFELVQQGKILLMRKREKADEDLLVYQPRNRAAKYLSDILSKVADAEQLGTRGIEATPEFQKSISKQTETNGSASSKIDRSAPDQLAYQCMPQQCARLKKLLIDLDTKEAQVVLRAAVYEVGTTKASGSAFQLVTKLIQGGGINLGSTIAGASQIRLSSSNFDAVLSLLDNDSRFHSISRPMLRVKTGAQAKFSVGQQVPVLGAISYDKAGNAFQSVDYRQSGTIFTVLPDVHLDVVDLTVTQELSSFVNTTTGVNNSPTLLQRTATSQLSIKTGEVIVFAGLEDNREDDASSHLFGWSLGNKNSKETTEVLVFIEAQSI